MKRAVAIATLCGSLAFAVSACAAESDGPGGATAERRATETTPDGPTGATAARGVRLLPVGRFDQPTYIASPPGDRARRFVTEREGRVVLLRGGRRSTFLDIADRVQTGGESGLLSIAFHPGYARNRRYFVYYVANDGAIAIFQFRATANGDRTRPGSGRLVMRVPHPRFNHKGGQLQFGHDGMLYAGFGDGGGGGDPDRNAQDLGELLGKIVRIDPRPGGGYRIPRDNPFRGRAGARGEIFAYGLRNPYRFSFDRVTGAMAIGDVGQDAVEEIDFLPAAPGSRRPRGGANLGWSVFEGNRRFRSGSAPGHVRPVIERTHDQGSCSITGGYVIRDRRLGALRGSYVYGDLCDARLRVARLTPRGARRDRALGPRLPQLVSFGEDARGRVYAVSLGGGVFRLAPRR
ncbi:MAG TPA: PQQ-dependent sugar dehydrogenase [Thermoleophilaceae bacterium]|nr:PQQ-dependent sugar dehydrogenase [Thermoleophilaceae bacterium]